MSAVALASAPSFAERVMELLERLDYRLARSEGEREAIYRLRYDAYLREGSIAPNFGKRLTDRFEDSPNAWTYGLFIDDKLASSIRIHVASQRHPISPALDAFSDALAPQIERGKIIVDPNRFVADYASARAFPELPYLTVRLGFVACGHFNADIGLATARAEHQAFYRRVFRLDPICPPRPYPTLTKPLSLMGIDYPSVKEQILARYPFFRSTYFERRMLFGRENTLESAVPLAPHRLVTIDDAAVSSF